MFEVKVKEINKRNRKGNDGDHEIRPIELVEIDDEPYDGGRTAEDALDNEKAMVRIV